MLDLLAGDPFPPYNFHEPLSLKPQNVRAGGKLGSPGTPPPLS